jgi:nucleoside-diphosphate-sugar epimerase
MKVLLTGGSGNLGQTLVPMLLGKGDTPVILDVRAPRDLKKGAVFIETSILDRSQSPLQPNGSLLTLHWRKQDSNPRSPGRGLRKRKTARAYPVRPRAPSQARGA